MYELLNAPLFHLLSLNMQYSIALMLRNTAPRFLRDTTLDCVVLVTWEMSLVAAMTPLIACELAPGQL